MSTASSTTPREGSVKPGAASPSASEPGPSRVRQASRKASASSAAVAVTMRGSTPAAAPAAASPAPNMPPNAQPACSEDMIGRPRRCSTATPWAFMETSMARRGAAEDEQRDGQQDRVGHEQDGDEREAAEHAAGGRPSRRLPRRTMSCPATGRRRITPSGHRQQDQPDDALAEAEALLHPRDLGDPGAEDGAVHEEHAGGGGARAHARVTVTPRAR